MREVATELLTEAVKEMCISANKILPEDLEERMHHCMNCERNTLAQEVLGDCVENLKAAREMNIPICQDTGMAVCFVEVGQDVHFVGQPYEEAIEEGVRRGYLEGLLRLSIVKDPIRRGNTNDNTPPLIYTRIVPGDKVKITVAPKGFGSENMSQVRMLTPSATREKIIDEVVDVVRQAGSNPCPPMVVGVGIGGDFEYSAYLAKKALCREVSIPNADPYYADMEQEILKKVNELDIGPQGFGGDTTALAVNIETYPTHIAGLPMAVNIGCHVTRHETRII